MWGADVACTTTSAAARGDVADLERARYGWSAFRARVCSMIGIEGRSDDGIDGLVDGCSQVDARSN